MSAPLLFHPSPDAVYGFPHARRLARVDSPYQRIEVWDTPQLGRLFTLDGRPMTSTGDEFIYHECMVHPAALAHPSPRAALVLGGGDGGAARQLLRHPSIERIVVAELDAQVVRLTREYLPEVHGGAFDDPRVELVIGDAAQYVAAAGAGAVRPRRVRPDAAGLTRRRPLHARLLQQLKRVDEPHPPRSPCISARRISTPSAWPACSTICARRFAIVRTMSAFVPLYGSLWMMATASDTLDPAALSRRYAHRAHRRARESTA